MTLPDNTEITHSQYLADNTVKVYIETPDAKDCFHHMTIIIPGYKIQEVFKYTPEEIDKYTNLVKSLSHLIIPFSQQGGFANATDF